MCRRAIAGFLVIVVGTATLLILIVWAGKRTENWLVGQDSGNVSTASIHGANRKSDVVSTHIF